MSQRMVLVVGEVFDLRALALSLLSAELQGDVPKFQELLREPGKLLAVSRFVEVQQPWQDRPLMRVITIQRDDFHDNQERSVDPCLRNFVRDEGPPYRRLEYGSFSKKGSLKREQRSQKGGRKGGR